jgi:hypothetical protein
MATQSPLQEQPLKNALDVFIQTANMEEGLQVLQRYPELLSDQADLLLSSIIHSARQQGHEGTAQALDERRDFIRNVRQETEGTKSCEL